MARVVIENLSKIFRGPAGEPLYALRDANLAIAEKEFVVLVGPSGCGKSTTLRLIAGLEEISRGSIWINGQIVNDLPPKDRDIAMVFQNYALYPHMTVYENLAFGLKLRKVPKPEIERRVREAAEILGLTPCLERRPKALSGGQRQRVALGRAIVRQPKLFLFDEPLSNLDAPMRVQMRAEIARLHTRLGATILYVTHDQVEAMTMGDRIVVMNQGVIQQVADPLRLYQAPVNMFVAGFIGSPPMNFFHGTLLEKGSALNFVEENNAENGRTVMVKVAPAHAARVRNFKDKAVILGLRPEHIHPAAPGEEAGSLVAATIEMVEPMGSETFLYLTTGAHAFIARMPGTQKAEVRQTISLRFEMSQAHYFDPISEKAIIAA